MNLRERVWLPPDGDPRLIRFQDDVARALGTPGAAAVPPFLPVCGSGRVPSGPVSLTAWGSQAGELVLEARDLEGPLGCFRFGLRWTEGCPGCLPAPPSWSWDRGKLATLVLEAADPSFVLWSWEEVTGWRAAPARG